MKTENTIGDNGSHGEVVKSISKVLPDIGVSVLSETFIVKPVDLGDLATLVISPQNGDPASVSDFQGNEQRNRFERVISSIDVVTHEHVICFGTLAADTK